MATLPHPDAVGMDPEKLEQVTQLFHAQIQQGLHPGAGLAVYRYGQLVLDIHGGVSDIRDGGGATQPVTSKTLFVLMSSTKPLPARIITIGQVKAITVSSSEIAWTRRHCAGRSLAHRPAHCHSIQSKTVLCSGADHWQPPRLGSWTRGGHRGHSRGNSTRRLWLERRFRHELGR